MLFLLLVNTGFAAEPTIEELRAQHQIIETQEKHADEAFERGRAEIQMGSLRQGLSAIWRRELKAKREEIEAKIKALEDGSNRSR